MRFEEFLSRYLTEEQVAQIIRIKPSTLAKRRRQGRKHPPLQMIGEKPMYPADELAAWLEAHPIQREKTWAPVRVVHRERTWR